MKKIFVISIMLLFSLLFFVGCGNTPTNSSESNTNADADTSSNSESSENIDITEPEETKEEYINSCKEYTFKEIARNPNNYINKRAKFTGEVIQVQEENGTVVIRLNVTKSEYDYYEDTILVGYKYKDENESKILEDDIITVYGELKGNTSYESVLGSEVTLPLLIVNYVEIN